MLPHHYLGNVVNSEGCCQHTEFIIGTNSLNQKLTHCFVLAARGFFVIVVRARRNSRLSQTIRMLTCEYGQRYVWRPLSKVGWSTPVEQAEEQLLSLSHDCNKLPSSFSGPSKKACSFSQGQAWSLWSLEVGMMCLLQRATQHSAPMEAVPQLCLHLTPALMSSCVWPWSCRLGSRKNGSANAVKKMRSCNESSSSLWQRSSIPAC